MTAQTPIYEIIDGLQRLNAIVDFIENCFCYEEHFFDLSTIAETKKLLDEGSLQQREPILARSLCTSIAGYPLPISVYAFSSDATTNEVFRRINSNGRFLSPQEIRAAGALDPFPTLARRTAARLRGDVTHDDMLPLKYAPRISIGPSGLGYGIDIDSMFWVRHNIISRDQVRESRDEEILADLISFIVLNGLQP